jgi:hypothetical protein
LPIRCPLFSKSSSAFTETSIDQALHCSPLSWAERLKRVFDIDISVCPLCGGKDPVKGRKTISLPLSDG